MTTMYTLSVTVPANKGTVILQDNFPTEGPFTFTVAPGTTGTAVISDNQFGRIKDSLLALVVLGDCTYTVNIALTDPLYVALAAAIGSGGGTSAMTYKGSIATGAGFPLLADVATGWFYHVTADVTDNVASHTNTGLVFLAGDEIVWDGSTWVTAGTALTNPMQFKGSITNAASFPPPAATATTGVKDGWVYRVTTGCTDNGGAGTTNTGQVFLTGDIIVWRTSAWYLIQKAPSTATPAAVGTAAAGTSGRPSNDDHAHAHGSLAGGSFHAAAVAATSDGFMTRAMASDLAISARYKGAIAVNTSFPLLVDAVTGWMYNITATVTDNAGVTYTNTGLTFYGGEIIFWTGATWISVGGGVQRAFRCLTNTVEFDNGNSSGTHTIDWNVSNSQKITLTAGCTLTFTPPATGPGKFSFKVIQGGAGSYAITWPATCMFTAGVAPTLTGTLSSVDILTVYYDGANYHVGMALANVQLAP